MLVSDKTENLSAVMLGSEETSQFSINLSPEFVHTLSSSLYSNPQFAVVRETLCNAWDAHVMNDCVDTPIEVTVNDNEFVIKDFGPGIPNELMKEIYCVYGNSTKTQSANEIGGFGLGCKAPYAVTDSFIVENCHNGTKTIYSLLKADARQDMLPSCTKVVSVPSQDTGLTVKIPLVKGFSKAQVMGFVMQLAEGSSKRVKLNDKLLPSFETGKIAEKLFGNIYLDARENIRAGRGITIRYGGILYSMPKFESGLGNEKLYSLDNTGRNLGKDLNSDLAQGISEMEHHIARIYDTFSKVSEQYGLRGKAIIIDCPPNSITLAPSRESITVSDLNTATLREIADELVDHIIKIDLISDELFPPVSRTLTSAAAKELHKKNWSEFIKEFRNISQNMLGLTVNMTLQNDIVDRRYSREYGLTVRRTPFILSTGDIQLRQLKPNNWPEEYDNDIFRRVIRQGMIRVQKLLKDRKEDPIHPNIILGSVINKFYTGNSGSPELLEHYRESRNIVRRWYNHHKKTWVMHSSAIKRIIMLMAYEPKDLIWHLPKPVMRQKLSATGKILTNKVLEPISTDVYSLSVNPALTGHVFKYDHAALILRLLGDLQKDLIKRINDTKYAEITNEDFWVCTEGIDQYFYQSVGGAFKTTKILPTVESMEKFSPADLHSLLAQLKKTVIVAPSRTSFVMAVRDSLLTINSARSYSSNAPQDEAALAERKKKNQELESEFNAIKRGVNFKQERFWFGKKNVEKLCKTLSNLGFEVVNASEFVDKNHIKPAKASQKLKKRVETGERKPLNPVNGFPTLQAFMTKLAELNKSFGGISAVSHFKKVPLTAIPLEDRLKSEDATLMVSCSDIYNLLVGGIMGTSGKAAGGMSYSPANWRNPLMVSCIHQLLFMADHGVPIIVGPSDDAVHDFARTTLLRLAPKYKIELPTQHTPEKAVERLSAVDARKLFANEVLSQFKSNSPKLSKFIYTGYFRTTHPLPSYNNKVSVVNIETGAVFQNHVYLDDVRKTIENAELGAKPTDAGKFMVADICRISASMPVSHKPKVHQVGVIKGLDLNLLVPIAHLIPQFKLTEPLSFQDLIGMDFVYKLGHLDSPNNPYGTDNTVKLVKAMKAIKEDPMLSLIEPEHLDAVFGVPDNFIKHRKSALAKFIQQHLVRVK